MSVLETSSRALSRDARRPIKVAVAWFAHETCTFCPGGDVTIEDWLRTGTPRRGDELLEKGDGYIQGFVDQARDYGDMDLIGLESPCGVYGGTSRSWNTEEAFDHFVGRMLADLRAALPVDGVFLALHGAMAVRNLRNAETEMVRRFRDGVGPDVPIVATLDLHANQGEAFLAWATGAFATKRFPHYDDFRQGQRAARYLRRVARGSYTPARVTRKIPLITATVLQWTGASPVMEIMERARRWEDRVPGAFVNVLLGFPWSDVADIGTTVQVMTNGDPTMAATIAEDVANHIWRVRDAYAAGTFPMPAEAVRLAREAIADGKTPVVLADYADRPGDATWILRELVDQNVGRTLFAALTDRRALDVIQREKLQPGDAVDLSVGGYMAKPSGTPVRIRGTLCWRGVRWGYDPVAVIAYGNGNRLILVPAYKQVIRPEELRFGPIDPDDFDVIVIKSRVHFRRGFDETGYAPTILVVDTPGDGVGTIRLDGLTYQNGPIQRLYPFGTPPESWLAGND